MRSRQQLHWLNTVFLVVSPLAALAGVVLYFHHRAFHLGDVLVFSVMASLSGLSITAGYHRYYSHRSYECHPVVQWFYLLWGGAALQNSAVCWASNHRYHHRFVDREGDPHNIQSGLFWTYMGWIFFKGVPEQTFDNVPDLLGDRKAMWQHRHYLVIGVGFGFILPFLLGFGYGRPWSALLWGGLVRVALLHHCAFLGNLVGHLAGDQPHSQTNSSRDNWWLSLLTFGEGYHNFHHTFPGDYRGSTTWYHWDPTRWWIGALSHIGLTSHLKTVGGLRRSNASA